MNSKSLFKLIAFTQPFLSSCWRNQILHPRKTGEEFYAELNYRDLCADERHFTKSPVVDKRVEIAFQLLIEPKVCKLT